MAIPATQMRPGMIIKHNDQLHSVFNVEHRTPGNLRAFIQAKLRNVRTGAMFEHRFRSGDAIERVIVDEVAMEFLYNDGDDYYFMNPEDYEQTVLKQSTLGDAVEYLTPNLQIKVSYYRRRSRSASTCPPPWNSLSSKPSPASSPLPPPASPSPPSTKPASSSRCRPSSTKVKKFASTPAKAPTSAAPRALLQQPRRRILVPESAPSLFYIAGMHAR